MKKSNLIPLLLVLSTTLTFSQTEKKDSILDTFLEKISSKWTHRQTEKKLTLTMRDSMWVDFYNTAGVPHNDPARYYYSEDSLKKRLKPIHAELEFSIEPRWTDEKAKKTAQYNRALIAEIDSLKFKHKISHLKFMRRYSEEIIVGATKQEEKRITKYRKEKAALEARYIEIPVYNTEHYSLIKVRCSWEIKYAWHMRAVMFPASCAKQADELDKVLYDYLRRPFDTQ